MFNQIAFSNFQNFWSNSFQLDWPMMSSKWCKEFKPLHFSIIGLLIQKKWVTLFTTMAELSYCAYHGWKFALHAMIGWHWNHVLESIIHGHSVIFCLHGSNKVAIDVTNEWLPINAKVTHSSCTNCVTMHMWLIFVYDPQLPMHILHCAIANYSCKQWALHVLMACMHAFVWL